MSFGGRFEARELSALFAQHYLIAVANPAATGI